VLDALYGPGARTGPSPRASGVPPGQALAARLDPGLRRLLEAVETGVGSVEGLAADADVAEVLAGLSELEFLGFVTRGAGGDYVRRA
jgi:hypothetical protein